MRATSLSLSVFRSGLAATASIYSKHRVVDCPLNVLNERLGKSFSSFNEYVRHDNKLAQLQAVFSFVCGIWPPEPQQPQLRLKRQHPVLWGEGRKVCNADQNTNVIPTHALTVVQPSKSRYCSPFPNSVAENPLVFAISDNEPSFSISGKIKNGESVGRNMRRKNRAKQGSGPLGGRASAQAITSVDFVPNYSTLPKEYPRLATIASPTTTCDSLTDAHINRQTAVELRKPAKGYYYCICF